jgi:hypothetical protein
MYPPDDVDRSHALGIIEVYKFHTVEITIDSVKMFQFCKCMLHILCLYAQSQCNNTGYKEPRAYA